MHPPEPIYPCYLPVLGEFNRMTPHEGPSISLPEVVGPSEFADMGHVRAMKWTCPLGAWWFHGTCPLLEPRTGHIRILPSAQGVGRACPIAGEGLSSA